jgi:hypothetical protein
VIPRDLLIDEQPTAAIRAPRDVSSIVRFFQNPGAAMEKAIAPRAIDDATATLVQG